jgi:acyl carrier protein phosphodiesterase
VNFLVHLYLSDPSEECLLGNLMGDYVKGRLTDAFPPPLRQGLWQHRRVDAFAHSCLPCRRSRARIDPRFGHLRGILVDIFYDHLLASNWSRYHAQPLEAFAEEIYALLTRNAHRLPPGLKELAPRMVRDNWLVGYRDLATIGRVLARVAQRLPSPNPLAEGLPELIRERTGLAADCDEFLHAARADLQAAQATGSARITE